MSNLITSEESLNLSYGDIVYIGADKNYLIGVMIDKFRKYLKIDIGNGRFLIINTDDIEELVVLGKE